MLVTSDFSPSAGDAAPRIQPVRGSFCGRVHRGARVGGMRMCARRGSVVVGHGLAMGILGGIMRGVVDKRLNRAGRIGRIRDRTGWREVLACAVHSVDAGSRQCVFIDVFP